MRKKTHCRHEDPLRVGAEGWGGSAWAEVRQKCWDEDEGWDGEESWGGRLG